MLPALCGVRRQNETAVWCQCFPAPPKWEQVAGLEGCRPGIWTLRYEPRQIQLYEKRFECRINKIQIHFHHFYGNVLQHNIDLQTLVQALICRLWKEETNTRVFNTDFILSIEKPLKLWLQICGLSKGGLSSAVSWSADSLHVCWVGGAELWSSWVSDPGACTSYPETRQMDFNNRETLQFPQRMKPD